MDQTLANDLKRYSAAQPGDAVLIESDPAEFQNALDEIDARTHGLFLGTILMRKTLRENRSCMVDWISA